MLSMWRNEIIRESTSSRTHSQLFTDGLLSNQIIKKLFGFKLFLWFTFHRISFWGWGADKDLWMILAGCWWTFLWLSKLGYVLDKHRKYPIIYLALDCDKYANTNIITEMTKWSAFLVEYCSHEKWACCACCHRKHHTHIHSSFSEMVPTACALLQCSRSCGSGFQRRELHCGERDQNGGYVPSAAHHAQKACGLICVLASETQLTTEVNRRTQVESKICLFLCRYVDFPIRRCRNIAKPLVDLQQGCNPGPCPELSHAVPSRTASTTVVLGWYSSPWQQVSSLTSGISRILFSIVLV